MGQSETASAGGREIIVSFPLSDPHNMHERGTVARDFRLRKHLAGYRKEASDLLIDLQNANLLPCRAEEVTLLAEGRVNYCSGYFGDGDKKRFLKVAPGDLERRYYEHAIANRIRCRGDHFVVPQCKYIRSAHGLNIFAFEWMDELDAQRDNSLDICRTRGLGEYNAVNLVSSDKKKLTGVPTHPGFIRDTTVQVLADLGFETNILEAQEEIISRWPAVGAVLAKGPLALSVRDSSRANVLVQRDKAVMIDNGAAHYAPMGFDLWSYLDTNEDMIKTAEKLSTVYMDSAPFRDLGLASEFVAISSVAASCIIGLDRFVRNKAYHKPKRIIALQFAALKLIEICENGGN